MTLTLSGDSGITFPDSSTQDRASDNAYEFVEGGDLTGTVAELVFDVDLDNYTYDFVYSGVYPNSTTGQVMLWRASSDGGTSYYTSGYYYAYMTSTTSGAYGDAGSASGAEMRLNFSGPSNTPGGMSGVTYISRHNDTGVALTDHSVTHRSGGSGDNQTGTGSYTGANTINNIKVYWSSSSNWIGSYSLYRRKIA